MGPQYPDKPVDDEEDLSTSPQTLVTVLSVVNVFNALLFGTAGFVGFIIINPLTVPVVLLLLWLIFFFFLLIIYEMRMQCLDRILLAYFGYLYSWKGRSFFLFLIGTLSLGAGILGIVACGFTAANLLFTIYALCKYPGVAARMTLLLNRRINAVGARNEKEIRAKQQMENKEKQQPAPAPSYSEQKANPNDGYVRDTTVPVSIGTPAVTVNVDAGKAIRSAASHQGGMAAVQQSVNPFDGPQQNSGYDPSIDPAINAYEDRDNGIVTSEY